jgi:hypothetical protein
LLIYDHNKLIGQFPISFQTEFEQKIECKPIQDEKSLEIYINVSRIYSSGFEAAYNSNIVVDMFFENTYFTRKNFTREDYEEFSKFSFIYEFDIEGSYRLEIILYDDFYPQGLFLLQYNTVLGTEDSQPPEESGKGNGGILALVGVGINLLLMIGTIKGIRWLTVKPKNRGERITFKKTESKKQQTESNVNLDEMKQNSFEGRNKKK